MFTGIVTSVGRIASSTPTAHGVRIGVDAGALELADVHVGDSIAVAGCCLTVVDIAPPFVAFDVSEETLRCTRGFSLERRVNLEKALRLSDRLGGHLVTGHVDGVARVISHRASQGDDAGADIGFELPSPLARYVAKKGSIAVEGVSLTTNDVTGARFTVHLIPHTLALTTLGSLSPGDDVNIEVDVVARYVERLRAN
jgi:riboflavin synthase